jgi:hypothetical protein
MTFELLPEYDSASVSSYSERLREGQIGYSTQYHDFEILLWWNGSKFIQGTYHVDLELSRSISQTRISCDIVHQWLYRYLHQLIPQRFIGYHGKQIFNPSLDSCLFCMPLFVVQPMFSGQTVDGECSLTILGSRALRIRGHHADIAP